MRSPSDEPDRLIIADACSLLDIVRSADRDELAGEVEAARSILVTVVSNPTTLRVATVDVANSEFQAHVEEVADATLNNLRALRRRLIHADEVSVALGATTVFSAGAGWEDALVRRGKELAQDLVGTSLPLESCDADRLNATRRTIDRRAPAKQGSSATHDCIIAERSMRSSQTRPKETTFLLTSNRSDFGYEGHRLDPDLEIEFVAAGLVYATRWKEVAGRLGITSPPREPLP